MLEYNPALKKGVPEIESNLTAFLKGVGVSPDDVKTVFTVVSGVPVQNITVRFGRAKGTEDVDAKGYYKPHPKLELTTLAVGPGARAPYPAMNSTTEYFHQFPKGRFNNISVGNYGYGNAPMVSFGFKYCSALVLRSPKRPGFRGFAHITSGSDPTEYVENLIALFQSRNLEAFVMKSQDTTQEALFEILKNNAVSITEVFEAPVTIEDEAASKDVIVFPEQGKIVVNIEGSGVKEIDF